MYNDTKYPLKCIKKKSSNMIKNVAPSLSISPHCCLVHSTSGYHNARFDMIHIENCMKVRMFCAETITSATQFYICSIKFSIKCLVRHL